MCESKKVSIQGVTHEEYTILNSRYSVTFEQSNVVENFINDCVDEGDSFVLWSHITTGTVQN